VPSISSLAWRRRVPPGSRRARTGVAPHGTCSGHASRGRRRSTGPAWRALLGRRTRAAAPSTPNPPSGPASGPPLSSCRAHHLGDPIAALSIHRGHPVSLRGPFEPITFRVLPTIPTGAHPDGPTIAALGASPPLAATPTAGRAPDPRQWPRPTTRNPLPRWWFGSASVDAARSLTTSASTPEGSPSPATVTRFPRGHTQGGAGMIQTSD